MFRVLLQGRQWQDKVFVSTTVNLIVLFSVINHWFHIEYFFLCHGMN